MKKTLKEYPNARLESCGQKKIKGMTSHKNGCYLKLNDNDVAHSSDSLWVIVDFDKNDEIRGFEFVDGIPYKSKLKSKRRKK